VPALPAEVGVPTGGSGPIGGHLRSTSA